MTRVSTPSEREEERITAQVDVLLGYHHALGEACANVAKQTLCFGQPVTRGDVQAMYEHTKDRQSRERSGA